MWIFKTGASVVILTALFWLLYTIALMALAPIMTWQY